MNTKILSYVLKNLDDAFKLERWNEIRINLNKDTDIKSLPWTPKRLEKFEQDLRDTFDVEPIIQGSVSELVEDLQTRFDGAAGKATDTFAGKMQRLAAAVEQAKEAQEDGGNSQTARHHQRDGSSKARGAEHQLANPERQVVRRRARTRA